MGTAQKMAETLAKRIKECGVKQMDIAKATKTPQSTISNLANVAPNMQLGLYGRITDYLDRLDKKREKEGK